MNFSKVEGILLVNKERGITSFKLISLLRKITKEKKIGHSGTLDPAASGVMVMLIGRKYTRLAHTFLSHDKQYLAQIHLGYTSKTLDSESPLHFISSQVPSLKKIKEILLSFQGDIEQIPPMFSAKKVEGKKLYELARKNIFIKRAPIKVNVQTNLIKYKYPFLELEITCSKGTYIRTIASNIGEKLKCGAYLYSLTRIRSGPFFLKDCLDLSKIKSSGFNIFHHLKK